MKNTSLLSVTQKAYVTAFTFIFFFLSAAIMASSFWLAISNIFGDKAIIEIIIELVNGSIIAIAVFELAMVISKEYGKVEREPNVIIMLRNTLPRFIGTVCIALSLEGLIMVIKYSQLELAGNLYYPVAIISSGAFLLIALGLFLKLAPSE